MKNNCKNIFFIFIYFFLIGCDTHFKMNEDKLKIVPLEILNGTYEEKYSFLCGYYMADGYKCENSKSKTLLKLW